MFIEHLFLFSVVQLSKDFDLVFQEKPHGWKKSVAQPSSLSVQKGETRGSFYPPFTWNVAEKQGGISSALLMF